MLDNNSDNPGRERIPWPDYARGIGILLVVTGHAIRGMDTHGLIAVSYIDAWIYSFHMPLFFFISGLFSGRALQKPIWGYLVYLLKNIAYPYFIWSFIQTVIQICFASYTNHPAGIQDLLFLFYQPVMQFWFLYVLFIIMLFWGITSKCGVSPFYFFIFSLLAYFSVKLVSAGSWGVIYLARNFMIYFSLGLILTRQINSIYKIKHLNLFLVLVCSLIMLCICVGFKYHLIFYVKPAMAILGITFTIALSVLLEKYDDKISFIRTWGALSLQIYVTHTIVTAGFRLFFLKIAGIHSVWLHVIGGTFAGMYFPILFERLCQRAGFRYFFRIGD